MAETRRIEIEDVGIGTVLKRYKLVVPPNQREYSWSDKEVGDLLNDLQKAIDEKEPAYFLGTIALTGPNSNSPEVTDGQQRLATTMILLAAMRDYFHVNDDAWNTKWVEGEFLSTPDPEERRDVTRLTLNVDDRSYFTKQILSKPGDSERKEKTTRRSHERIKEAFALAHDQIKVITNPYNRVVDKINRLRAWVDYIRDNAIVIVLKLPNDQNAFRMFETLNDRGLKTSQVDILKNYLFKEARDQQGNMGEVQPKWSRMMGTLEGLDGDDVEITFVRHYVITQYGMTRSGEVYGKIEQKVAGRHQANEFVSDLEANAVDYAAIVSPDHRKWNEYNHLGVKNSLRTMRYLKVVQIRPVMLAATRNFKSKDIERTFRLLVNWTVRFLVVGGGRSETLERGYAEAAHDITTKKITDAKGLAAKLLPIIPNDVLFKEAFATASVPKNSLARYYLRALELYLTGGKEPEWVPNEDASDVNLEHVLPENPGKNWPKIDPELASAMYTKLGNLVLLQVTPNTDIGNLDFTKKKAILAKSTFVLTAQVAKYRQWGPNEIKDRQAKLAEHAWKTWPLDVK